MDRVKERIYFRSLGCFIVSALFLSLFLSSPTYAQVDYYWVGSSGSWDDPSNWSLTAGGPGGAGPPSTYFEQVFLTESDAINRVVSFSSSPNYNIYRLFIGGTGTGTMTLSVSQGGFGTPSFGLNVGDGGIVQQTGGTIQVRDYFTGIFIINGPAGTGTYNISEGTLDAAPRVVHGTFNQSGGSVNAGIDATASVGSGSTYNLSGGQLYTGRGMTVDGTFNQSGGTYGAQTLGLQINSSGTYNLTGGTLDSGIMTIGGTFNQSGGTVIVYGYGNLPFTNTAIGSGGTYNLSGGILSGSPLLGDQQRGILNSGTFNYSGGSMTLSNPTNPSFVGFINDGTFNLYGGGIRTVDGNVVNNGTVKTSNTTAVFTGTFTNNGAYISDPAKNYFTNLTIGTTGYLAGGAGDEFHFSGDFLNHSQNPLWNTAMTDLFFGPGTHTFFLGDTGSSFTWDDLTLDLGATLDLEGDATLHVKELRLFDFSQLTGVGQFFYDSLVFESVPEPSVLLLLGPALIGLVGFRRKFKK